jgi:hypothetical protein
MEDLPDLKKTLSPYGVSHITQNLKSLHTISNKTKNEPFMLFTHHKKLREGTSLHKSYKELREAILELYLSVKIRPDEEIDAYNEDLFKLEKVELQEMSGY